MWLDRFSGHNTPSVSPLPRDRSSSPAGHPLPRGSSLLAPNSLPRRPAFNQRVSSWSGLTNGSTDSVPLAKTVSNGSSLRDQLTSTRSDRATLSLDALQSVLLDAGLNDNVSEEATCELSESDLAETIDFKGLSLQDFVSQQGDRSQVDATAFRKDDEAASKSFDHDTEILQELHKSIAACDDVLKSVESYLTAFQADLAAVSAEIETLQNRSTSLDTKLQVRKEVERLLGPNVEALSLAPGTARKIIEGPFDDAWVQALVEFEKRSRAIEARSKTSGDVKAIEDLRPFMNDLRDRAVERIRDYVVGQIKALRTPGANAQIIQQNALLRYRDAFAFLARHQPQLEQGISQAYINTMRWYYLNNFSRYKAANDKLNLHIIDRNDVLGNDDASKRNAGSTGSRQSAGPRDPFVIGRRVDVLRTTSRAATSVSVIEEDKSMHYMETPFRAFNLVLLDNASAEYSFLTEFFSKQNFHAINRRFAEIFEPTYALGQSLSKQLVENSSDALGILICVRLNQHFAFELQRRKMPAMEGYINGTSMQLWPRFQMVMDFHCESLRKATASLPGKPAGSALTLTAAAPSTQSVAPHPITQRFANFVQGILSLSTDAGDDEPVQRSLGRLRDEFEAFLLKLSKGIAEAKKRDKFLANNYSLIATIINDTEGRMAGEMKEHYASVQEEHSGRR